MKSYVLGFVFSTKKDKVLLIHKLKPEWQKGLLNGIGGKIEDSDFSPVDAMIREFKEETGVDIDRHKWNRFAEMKGEHFQVQCFVAFSDLIFLAESKEQEQVEVFEISKVFNEPLIYNLNWLIPMALDQDNIKGSVYYVD